MSDARMIRARQLHAKVGEVEVRARNLRTQRNRLMLSLHAEGLTYLQIALGVGCSPELVAKVCRSLKVVQ